MKYKVILRRYDSGYIPHSDLILIPIKFSGPPHPRHSWWPSYAYETRRHERALFSCSSYLISAGPYYSYLYLSISACAAEISVSVYYLDNDYEDTRRMPEPLPLSPAHGLYKTHHICLCNAGNNTEKPNQATSDGSEGCHRYGSPAVTANFPCD